MNKKLLLVDTKCPSGHIELYRLQILAYCEEFDVTFATTSRYFENFSELPIAHLKIRGDQDLAKGKPSRKLQQFYRMYPVLRNWKKDGYDQCVLLSFDTHVLGAMSWLIESKGLEGYLHNNIDEIVNHAHKRLLFRRIAKRMTFCVFEDYISQFLQETFGAKTRVTPHPRRAIVAQDADPTGGEPFVFCPSSECDPSFFEKLDQFCAAKGLLLVTKPRPGLKERTGLIVKDRFDNFDDLFLAADYIACGVDYQYRVSGVFYEALGNDKKIIANDCLFFRSVQNQLRHVPIFL